MLKKVLLMLGLGLGLMLQPVLAAVDMTDPYKMVISVAENTFNEIKAHKNEMKDPEFRKDLIRRDLMPYVDSRYAAYKVIGTNLSKTSAAERDAFAAAFAEYVVSSYADALGKYDNQELVSPAYQKTDAAASIVNVKFLIREAGKQDLELVFKLRRNSKTGQWKAFDMVAEGISMLQAKESELNPIIRNQGIAAATALLVKHNQTAAKRNQ